MHVIEHNFSLVRTPVGAAQFRRYAEELMGSAQLRISFGGKPRDMSSNFQPDPAFERGAMSSP